MFTLNLVCNIFLKCGAKVEYTGWWLLQMLWLTTPHELWLRGQCSDLTAVEYAYAVNSLLLSVDMLF